MCISKLLWKKSVFGEKMCLNLYSVSNECFEHILTYLPSLNIIIFKIFASF